MLSVITTTGSEPATSAAEIGRPRTMVRPTVEKYVELTELTRLRVASTVWFLLVGLGLFYIIWRIVRARSNAWLVNANALTALVILYPCCFINFDGMIANFNVRHCAEFGGEGSPLDVEYFEELGTPALAALDSVRDKLPQPWRKEKARKVSDSLHAQLAADMKDWRSWTWRRQRTAEGSRAAEWAAAHAPQPPPQASSEAAPLPVSPAKPVVAQVPPPGPAR